MVKIRTTLVASLVGALFLAMLLLPACNTTRHVPPGQHLLAANKVNLTSTALINKKGEIKDNLVRLIVQKPNSKLLGLRNRLWYYNTRYGKFHKRPDSLLPKSAERPVLIDTSTIAKTVQNMKSYLFNQGYFYAKIKDTVVFKKKVAFVSYNIQAGNNYLINKVNYFVDDSNIARIVRNQSYASVFKKNRIYNYAMFDEERSRLVKLVRNNGYYQFNQENIRFEIDTLDKAFLKDVENPLENAINFIATTRSNKKPTNDVDVYIKTIEDSSNIPYRFGWVHVYPDYSGAADLLYDSTKHVDSQGGIQFFYHENYVHSKVLAEHIFQKPGQLYGQDDHDRTTVKLNELGIFQYIRIQLIDNQSDSTINCNIFLNKNKRYDLNASFEVSNGSTYFLGNAATASFRNKNFGKGANLLVLALNGGVELLYNEKTGENFGDHFSIQTKYYGLNTSLDFPKFLAPVNSDLFRHFNLPHTIVTAGANVVDRVQYFTLVNTSAYFKYNWRATTNQTWELSPAFVNIIRLPRKTADFQARLDTNALLSASYKENFIEGENLTYTYNNIEKRKGKNYLRLKTSLEEAGGLLGGINSLGYALSDLFKINYAQYFKLDVDLQQFFTLPHSIVALRFYSGVGIPYGSAAVLPYVKQYYVGGSYSLRGWRIRTLGPGSYNNTSQNAANTLDRTGDIKLEANGEYRFPIVPLFAGTIKMNGAFFADAGNIWLSRKSTVSPGGEFDVNKLGKDIAMDVGAGTRFEIASFLTLRLDVAMPVKKPYSPYIERNAGWVFDKIDFYNSGWRAENVVVNLSIGYPF